MYFVRHVHDRVVWCFPQSFSAFHDKMAEKKLSKTNLLLDDRDSRAEKAESPLEFLGKFKLRYYPLIGNWEIFILLLWSLANLRHRKIIFVGCAMPF